MSDFAELTMLMKKFIDIDTLGLYHWAFYWVIWGKGKSMARISAER